MPRSAEDQATLDRAASRIRLNMPGMRATSQIRSLTPSRVKFQSLADRFALESANVEPEMRALRASAGSAVAQEMGRGGAFRQGTTLERALRGAKARQGIIQRGEPAIKSQSLKDRLAIVRAGISQAGRAFDVTGAGAQIRYGVDLSARRARTDLAAARSGAAGAAAGMIGAGLKDWSLNRQSTPPLSTGPVLDQNVPFEMGG